MNKNILIVAGFFLFTAGMNPFVVGRETAGQSKAVQNDGPLLIASSDKQQDKSDESADINGDAAGGDHADAVMPDMDPSPDSPDAPVKSNVEGPVEDKTDITPAEDQKQQATEPEQGNPAETSNKDKPDSESSSREHPAAAGEAKSKRELTPALTALRDKVRRTLAAYQKMPFNTRQNTSDEIINYCMALGCDAEITLFETGGERRANGLMCLCWNYRCAGYEPLMIVDGRVSARLGYGRQSRPSQLLAVLALSRVQADYPMRVGDTVRTVSDLAESEKLSCRAGADMSLKLLGLSFYSETETWQNDLDEQWSVERMIKEQLAQPIVAASAAGLDRMLALSYAIYRREKRNQPVEGQYARAKVYVEDMQKYALGIQNSDGTWGYFLSGKSINRDTTAGFRSTGHVLEWLTIALPDESMDDARVVSGINYLNGVLANQRYLNNLPILSTQEIAGAMRALHALAIYDERVFKPADVEKPSVEGKTAPATAKHETKAGKSR